jgi:hypothetical protein
MKTVGFLFAVILISSLAFAGAFVDKGVTYTSPWWQVKAGDGSNVLVVDNSGNMFVNATTILLRTAPPASLINNLIIQVGSTRKFSFNSSRAYIAGNISQNQSTVGGGGSNTLVIKNSTGAIVARFDGSNGNIYLKGFVNDADRDGYSVPQGDCDDNNASITLPVDIKNCGSCGNVCTGTDSCVGGMCSYWVSDTYSVIMNSASSKTCNTKCVELGAGWTCVSIGTNLAGTDWWYSNFDGKDVRTIVGTYYNGYCSVSSGTCGSTMSPFYLDECPQYDRTKWTRCRCEKPGMWVAR